MKKPDEPSALIRYSGFLLFLLFSICAFLWFVWSAFSLYEQISTKASAVIFDNGGLYGLGGGIALSALTYGILHEVILRLSLTGKVTKRITRTAFVGIGLMIILPQIVHYVVENRMGSNSYMICDQVSTRWLIYKHIAYVSNAETCIDLIFEKEKRLSEPLF